MRAPAQQAEPAPGPGRLTEAEARSRTWGFSTIFLVEMWERFGYYGMTALVVLFMVQRLGYGDDRANLTFGAFAAMVYAAPAAGGWIGDRVLGTRRTMVLGTLVLAAGYVLLAVPAEALLFPALGVIAVGNGLFKANPANLVSKLYEGEPSKIDGAFTLYYMAVNVGAALSQILTPLIAVWLGWHLAFAVCAAGLLAGLANYLAMRRHLSRVGSEPDFQPLVPRRLGAVMAGVAASILAVTFVIRDLGAARAVVWLATVALLAIFAVLIRRGDSRERRGLVAVLLLTAQGVLFFVYYQQMATSLTLFALRNVDLDFHGYRIPAGQVQALNPLWIFLLSPALAWAYGWLGRRRGDLHVATKFALGFAILSLGFFAYGTSGRFAVQGKVSAWWMIGGYLFLSLAELLISGLGLAMVARYVGPRLRGFVMGVWFLASGISQYLGSWVATFASVPQDLADPVRTLPVYTRLFNGMGLVALAGTAVAVAMLPLLKRLSRTDEGSRVAP